MLSFPAAVSKGSDGAASENEQTPKQSQVRIKITQNFEKSCVSHTKTPFLMKILDLIVHLLVQ